MRLKSLYAQGAAKIVVIGTGLLLFVLILYYPVFFSAAVPLPAAALTTPATARLLPREHAMLQQAAYGAGDAATYALPHHLHLWRSFHSGVLPFWEPYSGCGHPFLADAQPAVLYPLRLLMFLPDPWLAFCATHIADYCVRLAGMFLLLRLHRLALFPAAAGAFAYAVSGHFIAWNGMFSCTAAPGLLPWLIVLCRQSLARPRSAWPWVTAVAYSLHLFTGHLHYCIYTTAGMLIYGAIVLRSNPGTRPITMRIVLIVPVGILLAAPLLLPAYETYADSWRPARSGILVNPAAQLALFLNPDAFQQNGQFMPPPAIAAHGRLFSAPINEIESLSFIGTLPLFFALSAIFRFRRSMLPFFVMLLIAAAWSYSMTFNQVLLALCPPLGHFMHRRALVLLQFSLLATGLLALQREDGRLFLPRLILFGGCLLLVRLAAPTAILFTVASMLPVILLCLARLIFPQPVRLRNIAALLIILEALNFAVPRFAFAPVAALRLRLAAAAAIASGRPDGFRLRDYHGEVFAYGEELLRGFPGTGGSQIFSPARSADFSGRLEPDETGIFSLRYCQLLSVGRILALSPLPLPRLNDTSAAVAVYAVPRPLDRAAVFFSAITADDTVAACLLGSDTFPFRTTLILASPPARSSVADSPPAAVVARIVAYSDHEVRITCQTDRPGFLLLTDAFAPGWQATVNNLAVPTLRANVLFRAVPVPQGAATVVWRYMPTAFANGLLICCLTICVGAASVFIRR